jgi:hypothetical protein
MGINSSPKTSLSETRQAQLSCSSWFSQPAIGVLRLVFALNSKHDTSACEFRPNLIVIKIGICNVDEAGTCSAPISSGLRVDQCDAAFLSQA